jgi:hypothetical protein
MLPFQLVLFVIVAANFDRDCRRRNIDGFFFLLLVLASLMPIVLKK